MKKLILILMLLLNMSILNGCKSVVNKMAFHPDVENVLSTDQLPLNVKEIFIETKDNLKIQSYFIPNSSSDKVLIYFHGNAGNICHRLPDLMQISSFGINVLGVGYRGYGKSQGVPSEEGLYIDGKSSLRYVTDQLGFSLNNVIVLGRSIGSTVAINTAQNLNINGLILVAPLTSGRDHANATGLGAVSFLAGNAFDNKSKIKNILCPVLIIHGTRDQVIPFDMGKKIYEMANKD